MTFRAVIRSPLIKQRVIRRVRLKTPHDQLARQWKAGERTLYHFAQLK